MTGPSGRERDAGPSASNGPSAPRASGPRRVLLVGMMGAGKSTVGRRLADRLGWTLLDSDAEVEWAVGKTVPEIFAESGEAAFRRAEAMALAEATSSERPVVIAVAGGAVLDPANRELIKRGGLVVWLRASVATLARRVGDGDGRPLLENGAEAALARLYPQRHDLYAEVADLVVDVDGGGPDATVEAILGKMSNTCTS